MSLLGFMRLGWRGFHRLLPQHAEHVQRRATSATQKALDKSPRIRAAADATNSRVAGLKQAVASKWQGSKTGRWVRTAELRMKLGNQFAKAAAPPPRPVAPKPPAVTPTKASAGRTLSAGNKIKSAGRSKGGRSK